MMDSNLKRSIILENYQNPQNKGLIENDSYKKVNMNNESCIDELNIQVKIENGIIKDIKFDGEACAICISSASIMTEVLIGKTTEQVKYILQNFLNMIDEKPYDAKVLEEAIVYDDVHKNPNRKKCALLSWWGIEKILNEIKASEK
ncbi:MAG: SUF system NifU family Fe-S cluster assembly protein [Bacilli bacterium]|nr:SUF system NifU family Fe-S cluster assembly protein [Bacilli bacterium]